MSDLVSDWNEDLTPHPNTPHPNEVPMRIVQLEMALRVLTRDKNELRKELREERSQNKEERADTRRWARGVIVTGIVFACGGLGTLIAAGIGYGRLLEQSENTADTVQELRAEVRSLRTEVGALRRGTRDEGVR